MNFAEYTCGALWVPADIQGLQLDDELVGFPSAERSPILRARKH